MLKMKGAKTTTRHNNSSSNHKSPVGSNFNWGTIIELLSNMFYVFSMMVSAQNILITISKLKAKSKSDSELNEYNERIQQSEEEYVSRKDRLFSLAVDLIVTIMERSPKLLIALNAKDVSSNIKMCHLARLYVLGQLDEMNSEKNPELEELKKLALQSSKKKAQQFEDKLLEIIKKKDFKLYQQITHNAIFLSECVGEVKKRFRDN